MANGYYEMVLALRARNFISNDLRKVGADMGRLRNVSQLQGQKTIITGNRQRLADAKALAQAEQVSLGTGIKRAQLNKLISTQTGLQAASVVSAENAQRKIKEIEGQRLGNLAQLSQLTRVASKFKPEELAAAPFGTRAYEIQTRLNKAQVDSGTITSKAATAQKALQNAEAAQAAAAIHSQSAIKAGIEANIEGQIKAEETIKATTVQINAQTEALTRLDLAIAKGTSLENLGTRAQYVEHLGRAFQTLGFLATAAFGLMARSAAKFQTQSVLAATQANIVPGRGTSVSQILGMGTKLSTGIQGILTSGQAVAKPADYTGAAYTLLSGSSIVRQGSTTAQARKTIDLLKEFNQVAKANSGLVDLNGVTQAGLTIMNSFGVGLKNLPRQMDVMQLAVNRGRVTMGQFVTGLNQTAAPARAAGYSFQQMASTLAFLSTKFPNYARAAVGYARLLQAFENPKLIANLKGQGINITDASGKFLLPINQVIDVIRKKLPVVGLELANFFKKHGGSAAYINARNALTFMMQDPKQLDQFTRSITTASAAGTVASTAAATGASQGVKWVELKNQLQGIAIEIGTGAIPAFQALAKPIEAAVNWFNKLSPSTKHLVGEITAFVAIGTLLSGSLMILLGSFTRFYTFMRLRSLGKVVEEMLTTKGVMGGLGSEVGSVGTKFLLMAPLVAGAAFVLINYHKQVGEVIKSLGGLKNVLTLLTIALTAFSLGRSITQFVVLATKMREAGLAAIGLRTALLSIAGLVISAYVIIHYRRTFEDAVKKGLKGSGVPGFDTTMGLQGYDAKGNPIVNYNKGFLGTTEKNLGQDATKDFGGFMNRLTGSGPYGSQQDIAKKLLAQMKSKGTWTPGAVITIAMINAYKEKIKFDNSEAGKEAAALKREMKTKAWKDVASIVKFGEIPKGFFPELKKTVKDAKTIVKGTTVTPPPFDYMTAIKNVEALKAAAEKHPSIASWKAYEDALAALQKKATGAQLAAINDMLNQQKSATTKSAKDTAAQLQDITSNVMSMYDQLLQQNQSVMGTLFQGPYTQSPAVQDRLQFGGKLTGQDYFKDIKSQISQFKSFYGEIGKLQKRGAPQELIQQLIAAGPSALPAIKALAGMGKNQWAQYIGVFNEGQKLLHNQTMTQLRQQLTDYRKYGNNIAMQIISGMRDKRLGLANEIKSLIHQMFGISVPEVAKHAKKAKDLSNAVKAKPSPTHGPGSAHTYKGHSTTTKPIIGTHSRTPQSVTYNYNVTAPTSEHASVKTQLRHAEFVSRTKYMVHPQ